MARWWGPAGFTNTFQEFDLRPGGLWRFTMHGPDGANYSNESRFVLIDSPNRIVFDHICAPLFQVQISFEAISPKQTKVTFAGVFLDPKLFQNLRSFLAEKNEENLDRLGEELKGMVGYTNVVHK